MINKQLWHRIFAALSLSILFLSASAQIYNLEGVVGSKYPIVIELTRHDDGLLSGKYAYKSTLSKYGNNPCSWLELMPAYGYDDSTWYTRDCNLKNQDTWTNVKFNGSYLTARMKNTKGNLYDVSASVVSTKAAPDDLAEHFRKNLGKYPRDIAMFFDPYIQDHLETLMGEDSFNYLAYIFQTQFPIEYRGGMFWSAGFEAHNCCDPAAIWAYDTLNKSFYVWIRKDSREYTWSETGTLPIKFQELVQATF